MEECLKCKELEVQAHNRNEHISDLEAKVDALREALMDALECIEGAAGGHGVDFYAYDKDIEALLEATK